MAFCKCNKSQVSALQTASDVCAAHELPTQAHAAGTHLRNYVDTSGAAVNLSTARFTSKNLGSGPLRCCDYKK